MNHDGGRVVTRRRVRLLGGIAGLVVVAVLLLATLLHGLRAAPGEWAAPVAIGPWRVQLGVAATLRVATHPWVLRLLHGRTLATRFGAVQWRGDVSPNRWHAVCAPCRVRVGALGTDEIVLSRVELVLQRGAPDQWHGEFGLGDAPRALRGRWQARFDAYGAQIDLRLDDAPIADAFALFAASLPELQRARIDGRIAISARWQLPQQQIVLRPRIEGFTVAGLGTESLLNVLPSCDAPARGFGTWLPRAVIAAEDQRFYRHTGFDVDALAAAWALNQREGSVSHGGSTLSQQVAKLLYAGDRRDVMRKLRELLYAVELDRTLGKARLLNLYLAIAPWGDGRCGAHAAARHLLGKRVDRLSPTEAAWLASLLANPQRELTRFRRSGQVDLRRVAWIIEQMRSLPKSRRAALTRALPAWSPPAVGELRGSP